MAKDWTGNFNSVFKTLGASNHTDKERQEDDLYCTSPDALELFAAHFPIHKKVWECSAGLGHLSHWLEEHGHDVLATDLRDRNVKGVIGNVDFLKVGTSDLFDKDYGMDMLRDWYVKDNRNLSEPFDILTNPPYKYSTEFVLHALELIPDGGHVIMFLKTSFLEGTIRKREIYDINPPRYVFQYSGRQVCAKNGDFKAMEQVGSAVAYAMYVWSKHNKEHKSELRWL